ncbi:SDR family NAD(P)-dependent oxidoreductase [Sphingomonas profundi]|uniref:SDR family NAD(P)-dependent oxidoreductase n=1 Tax=Alterirhizorhabdus profundi TaxID=2681549 RepID=UPI0018D1BBC8|nr:SDR family NAD(P)-dependent oxidoreductase [Sphingomonas profundi]
MTRKALTGRVAVVTGGASGIGKGIAATLIGEGADVVIADVEAGTLALAAAELGAYGVRADVTDPASVEALAESAIDRFGRVDIVCNNAGVGSMGAIRAMSTADWDWLLDVNLKGVIHGTKAFLPLLESTNDAAFILNTASIAGLAAGLPGLGGYSVSKFAIVAFTEALAAELAQDGSTVGAGVLLPGPVRSRLGSSMRNRRDGDGQRGLVDVELDDKPEMFGGTIPWLSAEAAGACAWRAIRDRRLYTTTHPAMIDPIAARHRAVEAAFADG